MLKKLPVTAIIPTFNRAKLCYEALESIYAQSCLPAQVIVVDDGSSEDMCDVKKLLAQNDGLYLYQKNSGVASARNLGASHANQNWIAFLDSDDIWLPQKLEKQFQLHFNDSSLMISQTAETWLRNGKVVNQKPHHQPAQGYCFERCLEICCISASAVVINKAVFLDLGGFDSSFTVCEDYDLWIRLSRTYQVGSLSEQLVQKRRVGDSQLSDSVEAIDRFRLQALLKLFSYNITSEQRKLVASAIDRKIAILEKGAQKRGLTQQLEHYNEIRELLAQKSS